MTRLSSRNRRSRARDSVTSRTSEMTHDRLPIVVGLRWTRIQRSSSFSRWICQSNSCRSPSVAIRILWAASS